MNAAGGPAPSSAAGGQMPAVSKPGKCERHVALGKTTHVITHSWRLAGEQGLELITTLLDSKQKSRVGNKKKQYVKNDEDALASAAADAAHSIL
ncbi:unnamed protein product, partial [Pylaiella littoralis]